MLNLEDEMTICAKNDYRAEEDDPVWHVEYQMLRFLVCGVERIHGMEGWPRHARAVWECRRLSVVCDAVDELASEGTTYPEASKVLDRNLESSSLLGNRRVKLDLGNISIVTVERGPL